MNQIIIDECKEYIRNRDLRGLKAYFDELAQTEFIQRPNWPAIFQKVYLYACLKKDIIAVAWLETIAREIDAVQHLGISQTLAYGRHLINK